MPWSLGIVGDVVWNVFPELRTRIRDRLLNRIDSVIDSGRLPRVERGPDFASDDQLRLPESYEYVTFVLNPTVLGEVANGAASEGAARRLCVLLRLLLTYQGEDATVVGLAVEDTIERIATPAGIATVALHDPELIAYIRARLGMLRQHGE